jgi:biopolymer transport protein ExbD
VKYQRLVKVLDLLQINKLENISLITDKENKQ